MRAIRLAICGALLSGLGILQAAPCVSASFSDYRQLIDGCEIGDKRFLNFESSPLNTILGVSDDEVQVDPILGPNFGLRFTGPFSASGIDIPGDSAFRFDVQTLSNLPLIVAGTVGIDSEITGLGAITVSDFFLDGLMIYGATARNNPFDHQPTDTAIFVPTNEIRVIKDIFLSGLLGSATLRSIDQTFTQIPEPGAALLVLPGLALLGALRAIRSR